MGIGLISLGFWLLFMLAFNGTVGEKFVNYSFFSSAVLMIISGAITKISSRSVVPLYFIIVALCCYLPMIWQRFQFDFGINWAGLSFDMAVVIFMAVFIYKALDTRMIQT